jgi:hypothetical protein
MRLFVHGHFCLSSKGTSNKFCNIHGTKGIKSGHYLAAISCFRSSLLHGHDIRLSSTVFQYHPISGFYGAESTIPAPATPRKERGNELRCAPLSSVFSLLPLFSCHEAPSNGWQAGGSALMEESKEADDGLDEEAGGAHAEAVDQR